MSDIHAKVVRFITTNFYVPPEEPLADDESLLNRGVIDSTGVLEVIAFLEGTFAIKVEDEEMLPANLDAVASIVAFVERKQR